MKTIKHIMKYLPEYMVGSFSLGVGLALFCAAEWNFLIMKDEVAAREALCAICVWAMGALTVFIQMQVPRWMGLK